jgi:subtilisin family serine protease
MIETVIVRLSSDLLSSDDIEAMAAIDTSEAIDLLSKEFSLISRRLTASLSHRHERTISEYQWLQNVDPSDADLLSIEEEIDSGVLFYKGLLPSRSFVVTATEDVIAQLREFDEVSDIHPNYEYDLPEIEEDSENETDLLSGGSSTTDFDTAHLDLLSVPAARKITSGKTVKVAVLDSGLDLTHPEFAHLTSIISAEWDTIGIQMPNVKLTDSHGHGTHVTGILCGATMGVAPDIELYVGVVAPNGLMTFAQLDSALEWAARNNVSIVNVSAGKRGYRNEWEQSLVFAAQTKTLVVAAIGNNGPGTHRSPGDYFDVLSVGAVDRNKQAWVSTMGSGLASAGHQLNQNGRQYRKPDVYALGASVSSSVTNHPPLYRRKSGTSMATPAVAGVAALVKSVYPQVSVADLTRHIKNTAIQISLPASLGGTGLLVAADKAVNTVP